MRRRRSALALVLLSQACGDRDAAMRNAAPDARTPVVLSFAVELPPSADEAYLCYGFDASVLAGATIQGVHWTTPSRGATLHHAKLWATSELLSTSNEPFSCDPMPNDAIGINLWLPGETPLELPPDTGFELPGGTRTLVVEAHALRGGDEPSQTASVSITRSVHQPVKIASWLGLAAPVPAIRPMTREQSTGRCRLSSAFHALYSMPHMHLVGKEFHAKRLRGDTAASIVDVMPWDFAAQQTYETAIDFEPGDLVDIECVWENPTAAYVLPGIYTKNEMCTFGLMGWPPEGAECVYE
jgi:hypothetical protein